MKKTILFLDHTARMGGGEIALLRLATALDPHRFTPVAVLGSDGPLRHVLTQAGIETHVIALDTAVRETRKETLGWRTLLRPRALLSLAIHVGKLVRFLRKRRIDAVHTNSLKADILGALAARCAGIPVVWHVRDRIADDYLPAPAARAFRLLARILPHRVIANSEATLRTLGGEPCATRCVVHDGIPPACKASGETPSGGPVAGLIGRIAPWKGQHLFIQAAYLVHRRIPEARFRIIGSALFGEESYERGLRQLVHTLRLENIVTFEGYRDDIPAALAPLACAVHASVLAEPFGQVAAEAMACGKAVVAVNAGGIREIVVHRRTGLLVPMGDAAAMASAIETLLRRPSLARRMGLAGQKRIAQRFTIEQTARKVEAVYAGLWPNAHATA